jgi:hypothetical protein
LIVEIAALTSFGTTSPRYNRQQAIYLPVSKRWSNLRKNWRKKRTNHVVDHIWPFDCLARTPHSWFRLLTTVHDKPFRLKWSEHLNKRMTDRMNSVEKHDLHVASGKWIRG